MSDVNPIEGEEESQPQASVAGLKLDAATTNKLLSLFMVVFGFTIIMLVISELIGGAERLHAAIEGSGAWAPVVYLFVKALTYIVAPLSGTSIELAAGALFGAWTGIILSLIGSTLGAIANYWIARTLGRKGVTFFAGKKALGQIDATASRVGTWRLLAAARVVLSPIYDFISYAAGLARFPFGQFVVITLVAGIPVTIVLPLLGYASANSNFASYLLLAIMTVLFIVFGIARFVNRQRAED